jgi:hypothetical protein
MLSSIVLTLRKPRRVRQPKWGVVKVGQPPIGKDVSSHGGHLMKRKVLLVLGSALVSIIASALLGRLALSVTPFGQMVRDVSHSASSPAVSQSGGKYEDPMQATTHMLRLTTFVLDPIVAVVTGFLVGLWGGKSSARLAALGILPLAAFSVFSYPWLWAGIAGGAIDILVASGTARLVSAYRAGREHSQLSPVR